VTFDGWLVLVRVLSILVPLLFNGAALTITCLL